MALKDDRVEQCLRSCGSEFQMWGPKRREGAKAMSLAFVLFDFQHAGVMRVVVVVVVVAVTTPAKTEKG